ncbi:YhfG family protein [Andreprevotia chitinilytica]|uniref:YhfG family protein n=1 Tax=Andreprevotia chitinilytica TaxID=396808 RepID=UPI0012EC40EC|nr:YhfG family protein [Andreprevotia chitinilytica]
MPKSPNKLKSAYVAQTRLANYNASLQLEGYAPSTARVVNSAELSIAKAQLVLKYTQKP